jgi:hypothetical protein
MSVIVQVIDPMRTEAGSIFRSAAGFCRAVMCYRRAAPDRPVVGCNDVCLKAQKR